MRKGQLLARLNQTDARSQVRAAGANENKARRDWLQAERLVKVGALPATARQDSRSAFEAASANLAIALEALRRTELFAPVDGKIAQRVAEPGESIGAGAPVLLLDQTEDLVVKLGVTDHDLPRLKAGQPATLQLEDGSPPFKGSVSSIAPTPSTSDGLYPVEVRPERTGLQPGTLITVRFEEQDKGDNTLRIPLDALVRRNDKDWVFVVEGNGDQAVAQQRAVTLGHSEGQQMTVSSGIQEGERIITEGAYFLQNGQHIRVAEQAAR